MANFSGQSGKELRTWLLFVSALVMLFGFFIRNQTPSANWLFILGPMLGLSIIFAGASKERDDDPKGQDDGESSPRVRREDSEGEVGRRWFLRLRGVGNLDPGTAVGG